MGFNQLQTMQNFNVFTWIWKHKMAFLFLIFTLPLVISSIITGIHENNYSRPFAELGMSVINADYVVGKNVKTMENNIDDLVGIKKPELGIYQHVKYYWLFFWNIIWKLLSEIFLIIVPFSVIYFIFNLINSSTKAKNIILSVLIGVLFIFIINMLITIVSLVNGTITISLNNGNNFVQILQVIIFTMPFHGIISLGIYLIKLFI